MDKIQYLHRIQFQGNYDTTLESLFRIQEAHLYRVPFENLDIHIGRKIDLTKTYDKVVVNHRGGFCYELNGLFYLLLKELGFKVKMISARVFSDEEHRSPEYDHLAIIAELGTTNYLVDVGFGEFALHPLKIEIDVLQDDPRGQFMIQRFDKESVVVKKKDGDKYVPQYSFTPIERSMEEFLPRCEYQQTSPESHFRKNKMCSLPIPEGRITIAGDILKITRREKVSETQLNTEEEFKNALEKYFGITL